MKEGKISVLLHKRREKEAMRTFFEDLGKRLGETAETVTTKAGEAVEIQKLKNQVRILERDIEEDLAEIGRMVYEQFKAGDDVDEETAAFCEAVKSREDSIAEYKQKIITLKGCIKCEACGKDLVKDMAYCPYCGAKAPEKIVEDIVEEAEEAAENTAEEAESAVDKAVDAAKETAEKVMDAAKETAEKMADAVEDKVEEAAEKIDDILE